MSLFINTLQTSGQWLAITVAVLLCIAGIVLSCLSISGTWLVLAAAGILAYVLESPFPGLWTIIVFAFISVAVEVCEFAAGWLGITKRGGSKLAGFMALVGGFIGMGLGSLIPIPILGSLIGMLAGSFGLAFLVEKERLKKDRKAADIAWGAVTSRIAVILLKVCVTLGMILSLAIGMLLSKLH